MNRRALLQGLLGVGGLLVVEPRVRVYSFMPGDLRRVTISTFGTRGVFTFDAEGDIPHGALVTLVNEHTVRAARSWEGWAPVVGMRVQPLCELWARGLSTHPPRSQP